MSWSKRRDYQRKSAMQEYLRKKNNPQTANIPEEKWIEADGFGNVPEAFDLPIPTVKKDIDLSTKLPQQNSTTPSAVSNFNGNEVGSLIGQSLAMLGSAYAGRDPGKVANQFEMMREFAADKKLQEERKKQIEEQKKQADELIDPKSKISQQKRMVYESALKIKIPETFSATDLQDRTVLQGLVAQSQPAPMVGGRQAKEEKEKKPKEEKEKKNPFQKEITEISIRSKNALDSLDKIEKIVERYGTRELTGPQEKELQQLIQNVSINYNKVLDPTSVVREGEAKQVSDSLGLGGYGSYFTTSDTALKQIKAFKDMVLRSRNNALSGYANLPSDTDFNEEDRFVIEEYRKNPDDPMLQETYNNMLRSKGLK